ncbi:type II toxin-antitoxin system PemK/MazF family toxin [Sutcliffiella horikoshii]|uniref:Uncharacterized protein n=1 Tax=Sutcliffiella horikoshii TaxID=79883 RepID=A0A5D4TIF6_9BACI|nr:type II toxin-antitoxin system PemK/MazF family toxin [Sutcliffiella horikoshii]TYS74531.1 hypothetical protein FZC75_02200 [Sutcliffiella horikoshii]
MILRNDNDSKERVQDIVKSIYGTLLDKDKEYAINYAEWILKLLKDGHHNKQQVELNKQIRFLKPKTDSESLRLVKKLKQKRSKHMPKEYPTSLQKGDIINVEFGSGYCDELDSNHYGVILSNIVGSMYLVAPLTSVKPKGGEILYYDDLGLPSKDKTITKSYVLFNQIKFIHFRRLEKITSVKNGKKHLSPVRVKEIIDKFNSVIA